MSRVAAEGTTLEPQRGRWSAHLHAAVDRMREVSGADIIALYPYDEETDTFYDATVLGLPEGDLTYALADLAEHLRRFRTDEKEGKVPDDVTPAMYGPTAWLLLKRHPLISTDPRSEVGSSFVRRHDVAALVGLSLIVGSRVVGLLYLDYIEADGKARVDVTSKSYLQRVRAAAEEVAFAIDADRQAHEDAILQELQSLIGAIRSPLSGSEDPETVPRQFESILLRLLRVEQLDCAAFYVPEPGGTRLRLLASVGCPLVSGPASHLSATELEEAHLDPALTGALEQQGLHPLVSLTPTDNQGGVLVLADRDPAALAGRLPAERSLLQAATDLLGGMLHTERLLDDLGETSRSLGAVTRLSMRLLQPGATQEQTLHTAVTLLIDPGLPELDFGFANIFLLENVASGQLAVWASAGAAESPHIQAASENAESGLRVPAWAAPGYRALDPHDVLVYAARRRRTLVVAPREVNEDSFITGYPEDLLVRKQVPILRADGSVEGYVRAARLRESADRSPISGDGDSEVAYQITDDFTLNAELFDAYDHGQLVRVFVPFGLDPTGTRATGVLEAGFHLTERRRLERVQIEALRACAATIATAVETARLYEDVTRRARQLEIVNEVSRTIATSIDLEQTLRLVSGHMARALEASICLIALLEEDESAWYGAASSDMEDLWRQRRVERPTPSIVFEVVDKGKPVVIEEAQNHPLVSSHTARVLGIQSLVALPLMTPAGALGAVILGQRDRQRVFSAEEVEQAAGLADQAAMAIRNARLHAREQEEHHIQKDFVLVGFGQWGQKAYKHLQLLKNFFNFRTHIVELELPGRREALAELEKQVLANGDLMYWDAPDSPAPAVDQLTEELEPSCYVITYICTPADSHLPMLKAYYDLSNVILIEKPLGAPPEEYKEFLDSTDGSVQIIAADHYWFKLEVRLLEQLLTEERNLRAFLDEIEEVEIEILEEQAPAGSGVQIGMIADLVPHAFAILSLLTPLDKLKLDPDTPIQIGRYQPICSDRETYARLRGSFEYHGRSVGVTIDVGKGVHDAKWIKLSAERRMGGRQAFYKFDFGKGEAIDGTQSTLRAATRPIRQPGVPDNAHLNMLRHIIEKKNPAVGILSIREAIRANARIQALERMAADLLASGEWTPYQQGKRPAFKDEVRDLALAPSAE